MVPGVEYTEEDLCLEKDMNDQEEDLGKYTPVKLNKFEKLGINNMGKDVESFLYIFKLLSKLVRSCQYLNESKPKYIDSPFRMENEEPLGYVPIGDVQNLVNPPDSVMKYLFGNR